MFFPDDRNRDFFDEVAIKAIDMAKRDLSNINAEEGCDRCSCGCKYWENDVCHSCGQVWLPEFKGE